MRRDLIFVALASIVYSYLFFRQALGINFLVFTIVLGAFQAIRNPKVVKNKIWLLASVGGVLSGVGLLLYGNGLSLTANIISLLTMSFASFSSKNSLPIGLFHSAFSMLGSMVFMILDGFERAEPKESEVKKSKWNASKMLFYILIPLTVLIEFMKRLNYFMPEETVHKEGS